MPVKIYTTFDDPLAGGITTAYGINSAGLIVGYYADSNGIDHGFLYNPNGGTYTTLDDPLGVRATRELGMRCFLSCSIRIS